jgi:hypothetical protein
MVDGLYHSAITGNAGGQLKSTITLGNSGIMKKVELINSSKQGEPRIGNSS